MLNRKGLGILVVALALVFVFSSGLVQAQDLDTVVGETDIMLVGAREHVRTQETNLGNMITDLMVYHTGADVAITNGGGIRATIPMGEITIEQVLEVHPFENRLVTMELTGWELLQVLENGVSQFPALDGRFLQVSGMKYTFDPEEEPGHRIKDITVGGDRLRIRDTYVVATNDFLASGGDEYTTLEDIEVMEEYMPLEQAIFQYLDEFSPVMPKVEGRITIMN